MRKIIFFVMIILLLVGSGFIIVNGFELGNFQVWGMNSIIEQNDKIDSKNKKLSDLVNVTYPDSLKELNSSSEQLETSKKDYEEKAILVSNNKYYMQTEKYDIDYLWTRIGFHAKDNNVQIKIDVVNSNTSGLYDLNFTIAGAYANVTDFIYDIENDSKLGFKIEDFTMLANGDGVQGSFSCKEISINIEKVDTSSSIKEKDTSLSTDNKVSTQEGTTDQKTTEENKTDNTVENQ